MQDFHLQNIGQTIKEVFLNKKTVSIQVAKSFLPPMREYMDILQTVWESHQLTNGGVLLFKLMDELKAFLQVPHLLVTTNGTISLQVAIKTLNLKGEIITTPFSYIATSSSIVWEGCKPTFVDIEPDYWCIDASKIEQAITPQTSAILATHVFGNPCNIEKIEAIAKKHHLKVIYDAAHCFGVNYCGKSIFNYGSISVCSFHATKIFHTAEGGCLITQDAALYEKMIWLHNVGHNGAEDYHGLGINGKATELQAAMGLAVLPYVNDLIEKRKQRVDLYDSLIDKNNLQQLKIRKGTDWNYSYYPILFENEQKLLEVKNALNNSQIFPRRYFYPSLNKVDYLKGQQMLIAENIASRILCLPLYHDLELENIEKITSIVNNFV